MATSKVNCQSVVNPALIPYLEKHKIFDLFHDLATSLAIYKPKDHILYIRNYLNDFENIRKAQRIILIVPPTLDGFILAQAIQKLNGSRIIELSELIKSEESVSPALLASRFKEFTQRENLSYSGWIIYEFPKGREEAMALMTEGILPTCAIEIYYDQDYSDVTGFIKPWKGGNLEEMMNEHQHKAYNLQQILKRWYKKIKLEGQSLEKLAEQIQKAARASGIKRATGPPRVLLIGTRGSKRRTVAKWLKEKLKLVHIDMEDFMTGALNLENKTGATLRRLKSRGVDVFFKTIMKLLQERLLKSDCFYKGWVLTGFPRNLGDIVALDLSETPPNKVIILSIENEVALKNLVDRKVNAYDGRVVQIDQLQDENEDPNEYSTHPRDLEANIREEQKQYSENIKAIIDYCGDSCIIVDAKCPENELAEKVAGLIFSSWPISPPREVKPSDGLGEFVEDSAPIEKKKYEIKEQFQGIVVRNNPPKDSLSVRSECST